MRIDKMKVKLMMARNCMDVVDLAKVYGVKTQQMHNILRKDELTTKCLGRLAKALNCDAAYLLADTND